jgi:hypothetical protein
MNNSEGRKAGRDLVLHLAGSANPITVRLADDTAQDLGGRLVQVVRNGHTQAVPTVDGHEFVVNFGHVVVAYLA